MEQPSAVEPRAELFPHDADIGVRGIGPTCASAFEQAALAMGMAVTDPAGVAPRLAVEVTCEAPDNRFLLVDWLNALIYEMATRRDGVRPFCRRDRGASAARAGLGRTGG